ncbi:MAG: ATP synthase F0 subunit C [Planctomycetia bacterium]|nr:ATP synthase F0 subunit C [Planctomycetia bacterium]
MAALVLLIVLVATPAFAQVTAKGSPGDGAGAWGAGLVAIGGAYGIGRLAAAAMESMARQPEAGGRIFTSMIISAALIEGFTFFALVICYLQNPWA